MVSILEPFIDTIIICTITGLVILSSGVWTEKFENKFEESAMCYLDGKYSDQDQARYSDSSRLYFILFWARNFYRSEREIVDGVMQNNSITFDA